MNVLETKLMAVLVFSASLVTAAGATTNTNDNSELTLMPAHEFIYTAEMQEKAEAVSAEIRTILLDIELQKLNADLEIEVTT